MTGSIEYCHGDKCPIKETCLRFKSNINYKKHDHLSYAPYDHQKQRCGFYIGIDGENILSQNQITELFKKKGNGKH